MDVERKARNALEAARSRGVRAPLRGCLPEAILVECIAGALLRERVDVDQMWDSLRAVACITKPHTDAKTIVQLRREDVAAALARLQATNIGEVRDAR